MKKCPHCGTMNLDEETTCGACGANLTNPVESVDPWINEGPHKTIRCQICRARVPADKIADYYAELHPAWANWLTWRRQFKKFTKISAAILAVLIAVGLVTRNPGFPLGFLAIYLAISALFYRLDANQRRLASYR